MRFLPPIKLLGACKGVKLQDHRPFHADKEAAISLSARRLACAQELAWVYATHLH